MEYLAGKIALKIHADKITHLATSMENRNWHHRLFCIYAIYLWEKRDKDRRNEA